VGNRRSVELLVIILLIAHSFTNRIKFIFYSLRMRIKELTFLGYAFLVCKTFGNYQTVFLKEKTYADCFSQLAMRWLALGLRQRISKELKKHLAEES